jgi:hypothetical protein
MRLSVISPVAEKGGRLRRHAPPPLRLCLAVIS